MTLSVPMLQGLKLTREFSQHFGLPALQKGDLNNFMLMLLIFTLLHWEYCPLPCTFDQQTETWGVVVQI